MRDYGKVSCLIWRNFDFRAMSEDARWLALYILTCPHANMLGCFCLPNSYIADDLQWSVQKVQKAIEELQSNKFLTVDRPSGWMIVHKFLKWNALANPNQGTAAGKTFRSIPDKLAIKGMLASEIREYCNFFPEAELNSYETVTQTIPEPLSNGSIIDIDIVPDTSPTPVTEGGVGETDAFEVFWKAYPSSGRERGDSKKVCRDIWKSKKLDAKVSEIMDALDSWKGCDKWAKNSGEFIDGASKFLRQEFWTNIPSQASTSFNGKRKSSIPTTQDDDYKKMLQEKYG